LPERVTPLAGRLSGEALTALIAAAALFVGDDADTAQLAASLGVPMVGVQSGATDAVERAPAGPRAVAVARAMSCGPCYLSRLEDCPRGLACLRGLDPVSVYLACAKLLARRLPAKPAAAEPAPTARAKPSAKKPARTRTAVPAGGN
jgi:ADP-heptose:LPS heptosyltransferase